MTRIPDQIRQLVLSWPQNASHGDVEAFCLRHGVSRSWFYRVRALVREQGVQDAALKGSRKPLSHPRQTSDFVTKAVLLEREWLRANGWDYGPSSVQYRLGEREDIDPVPSRATIARIFERAKVTDRNAKKRPKRQHKRFEAAFANQRWQADGFEWTLASGETVTVIEIIDDRTRFSIGFSVDHQETTHAVLQCFKTAIDTYGRPVLVHTDNGSAFNLHRLGKLTKLVEYLNELGIHAITGRPGNPRSQGKVERSHRTVKKFLTQHPVHTRDELHTLLNTDYREYYNYQRAHQSLATPGRKHVTPGHLYDTLEKAQEPTTPIIRHEPAPEPLRPVPENTQLFTRTAIQRGGISVAGHVYVLGKAWTGQTIHVIHTPNTVELFTREGESLILKPWPPPKSVKYEAIARQLTHPHTRHHTPHKNCPLCIET